MVLSFNMFPLVRSLLLAVLMQRMNLMLLLGHSVVLVIQAVSLSPGLFLPLEAFLLTLISSTQKLIMMYSVSTTEATIPPHYLLNTQAHTLLQFHLLDQICS